MTSKPKTDGGESNAKNAFGTHPRRFCLMAKHHHFCSFHEQIYGACSGKYSLVESCTIYFFQQEKIFSAVLI